MSNKLTDYLKEIQQEIGKNKINLEKLKELSQQAKLALDKKIEQLSVEYNLLRKIKVPQNYIKLWKHRGQRLQLKINWRYLLSVPFIYGMLLPALFWHLCLEIYHQVCFRLYGIPLVDFREYFIYDRQLFTWLNLWEKLNCVYCSYVNNLIRYSAEIGGRTERYWCPIKYYRRINDSHSQYEKFVDRKNKKAWRKQWEELRDFSDLK